MNGARKIAELVEAFLRYRHVVLRIYDDTPMEKNILLLSTYMTYGKLFRRKNDADKWTIDELERLGLIYDINPKSCIYIKRLCYLLTLLLEEKQIEYFRLIGINQKKFNARSSNYNNWSIHELELIAQHFQDFENRINYN